VTPLPGAVFDGSDRWLEVSVNGSAMTPRQRIGSVAYAIVAGTARNVAGGKVEAESLNVGGRPLIDSSGKLASDRISLSVAKPLDGTGQAGSPLSIPKAGASSDGYLSSADWNAFKAGPNLAVAKPLDGTGQAGSPLSVPKAGASSDGYLSSADWNAFKAGSDKAGSGVPTGAVMFFNLPSCPPGWSDRTALWGGRYLVAKTTGATLARTVGNALANGATMENRAAGQHSHGVSGSTSTNGAHSHNARRYNGPADQGYIFNMTDYSSSGAPWVGGAISTEGNHNHGFSGASDSGSGLISGTNAPYVQLLICQKD
jgi:hypothetical protein